MAEPSERAVLRNLQKEQERERRRIRDRERRQSMTPEEREKHLARRRRNYQLRRQRAANANLLTSASSSQMLVVPSHEDQLMISIPVAHVHNDVIGSDAAQGWSNAGQEQSVGEFCSSFVVAPQECSNTGQEKLVGLEVPPHALDKLCRASRLNHIKHLARSLNGPVAVDETLRVAADVVIQGDASYSGLQKKGLRLIRVKQLARASSIDMTRTTSGDQLHEKQVEEHSPSSKLKPMVASDQTKVVEPNDVIAKIE